MKHDVSGSRVKLLAILVGCHVVLSGLLARADTSTVSFSTPYTGGTSGAMAQILYVEGTAALQLAQYSAVNADGTPASGAVLQGAKIVDIGASGSLAQAEARLTTYIMPRLYYGANNGTITGPGAVPFSGKWLGPYGLTDLAAQADGIKFGNPLTATAAVVNAQLGESPATAVHYTMFGGITGPTLNANSILIAHTWYGDTQLKGTVTSDDYFNFLYGYLNQRAPDGGPPGWAFGDFKGTGTVDSDDYFLWLRGYTNCTPLAPETLAPGSSAPAGAGAATGTVPEPGSVILVLAGVLLALGRHLWKKAVQSVV